MDIDQVVWNEDEIRADMEKSEQYVPKHVPDLIYWDHWEDGLDSSISIPAEVCEACSEPENGLWVPVSFCPEAMKALKAREARHAIDAGAV